MARRLSMQSRGPSPSLLSGPDFAHRAELDNGRLDELSTRLASLSLGINRNDWPSFQGSRLRSAGSATCSCQRSPRFPLWKKNFRSSAAAAFSRSGAVATIKPIRRKSVSGSDAEAILIDRSRRSPRQTRLQALLVSKRTAALGGQSFCWDGNLRKIQICLRLPAGKVVGSC
jgi:hypothetical protein